MTLRVCLLLLLAGGGWLGQAEPRARPRLTPPRAEEQEERDTTRDARNSPSFDSFQSYLQAEARRPVGLEARRRTSGGCAATAGPTPPKKESAQPVDPEILILPTVEIIAGKIMTLGTPLGDIESQLRSGEKAMVETWLDSMLNPDFLSLFGDTARVRAARARQRNEVLGWEKILLISLEAENSPEEKARIKADIDKLNTILRSWR